MFRRRRPIARAAVVGGAAYYAGKKHAEGQQDDAAQYDDAQAPEDAAAISEPTAPAIGGDEMVTQLENLKKLLDEGVLTQEEFDAQKGKLLGA